MLDGLISFDSTPTIFGFGALNEISRFLRQKEVKRLAVIMDPIHWKTGLADRALRLLVDQGVKHFVFDGVRVEPTVQSAKLAADFLAGVDVESVIALGGGSTIDTAKVANLLKSNPGEISDYLKPPLGKGLSPKKPLLPLIAIPTTAGSASEASGVAVLDIPELGQKAGISSRLLRPVLAIVDPALTVTCPAGVTSASGWDLICHAIESLTARPAADAPPVPLEEDRPMYQGSSITTDIWSLKAIELGGKYFVRALTDGGDREARWAMSLCSVLTGTGYGSAGVHIPHACSYPVATRTRSYLPEDFHSDHSFVPHGHSVIVTAPASFRLTYPTAPQKHLHAAILLGGDPGAGADSLPNALVDLMRRTAVPRGLAQLGITNHDVPMLVESAILQQRLLSLSPCPVSPADLTSIFVQSMENW